MPSWQNPKSKEEFLLFKYLGKSDWKTILDLGCGYGSLFDLLRSKGYLKGKKEIAIDSDEERVKAVKEKGFNCFVGNACNLKGKIADGSIDFLVSSQVIEHVPSDRQMVSEISRVLSPGGIALVSTVFKKPGAWYFYRCNGKWVLDPTHVREYSSEAQLLRILEENRLELLESEMEPTFMSFAKVFRPLAFLRFHVPRYRAWTIVCRKRK